MLLFQQIEELSYKYSDARKIIGEFVLNEKNHLENYTMKEIADKTYTSKSSMVRFAKALGFSGWKAFLKEFLSETYYEDTHYTDIDPNYPFAEGTSTKDIVYKMCNLQVESILDTADQLDINELEKASDILLNVQNIALMGQSPNIHLGCLFKRKMLAIGKEILLPDGGNQGLLAHSLGEKDCAILISYSGNNELRYPLNLIPILKEHKVCLLAITGLGDNLLRQQADCVLSISSRERLYSKIGTFATEESIEYLLNLLYACYFVKHYQKNIEYKIRVSRTLEKRYSQYIDMREDREKRKV